MHTTNYFLIYYLCNNPLNLIVPSLSVVSFIVNPQHNTTTNGATQPDTYIVKRDVTMTRAIHALQMFDMFSYKFFLNATPEDMERMQYLLLYVGMNKARERPPTIIGTCRIIDTIFNGRLPDTMEDWMGFHNIARKLGALIMNDALGYINFLVVDTHLEKVLPLIKWTKETKADKIATDCEKWLDRKLLKETNESIVGIRQLYDSSLSTKKQKAIIRKAIDRCNTITHEQLLVGLLK